MRIEQGIPAGGIGTVLTLGADGGCPTVGVKGLPSCRRPEWVNPSTGRSVSSHTSDTTIAIQGDLRLRNSWRRENHPGWRSVCSTGRDAIPRGSRIVAAYDVMFQQYAVADLTLEKEDVNQTREIPS